MLSNTGRRLIAFGLAAARDVFTETIRSTNRPTYQQVLELAGATE